MTSPTVPDEGAIRSDTAFALPGEPGEPGLAEEDDPIRKRVQADYEDLKKEAKTYTMDEVRSGTWFVRFLQYTLSTYTKKVDAAFFSTKYPNHPRDAIVDLRIASAKRYSMIEGGLSAGAYTAAVAATIGTAGGASPIALPAAGVSFVTDLLYTTRLQLHLAYDISVLYGYPIDMEDPEDLYDLVRVAFGVKAGETLRSTVGKLSPEAVRQGVKAFIHTTRLAWLQGLPVIGKYLLQRNIIKFAIPAVGIPMSMALNYYSTQSVARVARQVYRDKAAIQEKAGEIVQEATDYPLLAMKVIWLVVYADRNVAAEESWLLSDLTDGLEAVVGGDNAIGQFRDIIDLKPTVVYEEVSRAPEDVRRALYDAACVAACVDHRVQPEEHVVLEALAAVCGTTYDRTQLKSLAKEGLV